tara:strand:+ start:37 stop:150 length:114 start_codon:yes stop_codon:yes gene_type:complete
LFRFFFGLLFRLFFGLFFGVLLLRDDDFGTLTFISLT